MEESAIKSRGRACEKTLLRHLKQPYYLCCVKSDNKYNFLLNADVMDLAHCDSMHSFKIPNRPDYKLGWSPAVSFDPRHVFRLVVVNSGEQVAALFHHFGVGLFIVVKELVDV